MKKTQLFCLPYAGGSASFYNELSNKIRDVFDVMPVELPGHGSRISEPLFQDMEQIIKDVLNHILEMIDPPYALLGYSMGTNICYEVAHLLIQKGFSPEEMFLFANTPPHDTDESIYDELWTEKEFIDVLIGYGGLTKELLNNVEFKELFLPIIRSDFIAEKKYRMSKFTNKIPCGAYVFYCDEDNPNGEMQTWSQYFERETVFYKMEGNHFFIKDNLHEIAGIIKRIKVEGSKN